MDSFSISQLAQYSGIKPHTIRIWEQRYNALQPSRSEGNTRFYNGTQLRRLLNIVSLTSSNHKVSELCAMPDEKLIKLLDDLNDHTPVNEHSEYFISQLILAGLNYDELHFEKIFSHCLLRFGIKKAYLEVIYPLLVRIGSMWSGNVMPPAVEHFMSNCIRQKLFTAIDSLPPSKNNGDTWLLFLPEDEFHDTGLLLAHYLIRLAGKKVIYLGGNVPMQSLKTAIKSIEPQHLLLFLVHHDQPADTDKYLKNLSSDFNGKVYVSGNKKLIGTLKTRKNIQWLQSVEDLQQQLSIVAV